MGGDVGGVFVSSDGEPSTLGELGVVELPEAAPPSGNDVADSGVSEPAVGVAG